MLASYADAATMATAAPALRRGLRRPGGPRTEAHADHRRAAGTVRSARFFTALRATVRHIPSSSKARSKPGRPGLAARVLGHPPRLPRAVTTSIGIVLNRSRRRCRPKVCSSSRSSSPASCRPAEPSCKTNEQLAQKAKQLAEQKRRGRTQEPGNRAGPPRARGEGEEWPGPRSQVRVPRQTCRTS